MKKGIQNIVAILVSSIFLLTANGIFFIQHTCSKEKTSEIVFLPAEKKDCCKEQAVCGVQKEENSTGYSCCEKVIKQKNFPTTTSYKEKCCHYKNVFVKIVNSYFNSTFEKHLYNSTFVCTLLISPDHKYFFYDEIEGISRPPPIKELPIYQQTKTYRL